MCCTPNRLPPKTTSGESHDAEKSASKAITKRETSAKYQHSRGIVLKHQPPLRHGRWSKEERLAFLKGLRCYGKGNWKKIATLIPTRDTIQTKTHAQVAMKKLASGQNIFAELDSFERRFVSEEEERQLGLEAESRNAQMTTPTFKWKPEDFESAKALIMLRSDRAWCF